MDLSKILKYFQFKQIKKKANCTKQININFETSKADKCFVHCNQKILIETVLLNSLKKTC